MDKPYALDPSKEDVQKELHSLKKLYSSALADIEEKNQQLYDYKRELINAKALEQDYINEIEAVQSFAKIQVKKWQQKNQQLEEDLLNLKQSHMAQIESLQLVIASKDAQLEVLKISSKPTNESQEIKRCDDLSNENAGLRSTVTSLNKEFAELTESNNRFEKLTIDLEETINNLQSEVASLNENYKCKKDELIEANNLIETMQEDLILTKNELDTLKTKPLENGSQGNSLFAEVNDRRLQLQQNVSEMKKQYMEMKRENARLSAKNSALFCENAKLCQRWDDEIKEKKSEDLRQFDAYLIRISQLESLVVSYENQILERLKVTPENIVKVGEIAFVEQMLNNRNKEIERLLKQRTGDSLTQMMLSGQLKDAKMEIRKWRANVTQLQHQVGQLQNEIEQLKLNSNVTLEVSENDLMHEPKSVMKSNLSEAKLPIGAMSKSYSLQSDKEETQNGDMKSIYVDYSRLQKRSASSIGCVGKENYMVRSGQISEKVEKVKTVQFSENTLEPNITDRNRPRRGGRILENKPIFVPSIKKREL